MFERESFRAKAVREEYDGDMHNAVPHCGHVDDASASAERRWNMRNSPPGGRRLECGSRPLVTQLDG